MIEKIFNFVRTRGVLVNTAKSPYGEDRWQYRGITVGLSDGGYTHSVNTKHLHCFQTCGQDPIFNRGDMVDLVVLFEKLPIN